MTEPAIRLKRGKRLTAQAFSNGKRPFNRKNERKTSVFAVMSGLW